MKTKKEIYDKLVKDYLRYEIVAQVAYELWQQENCPEGRDLVNWFEAERRLKLMAELDVDVLYDLYRISPVPQDIIND